MGMRVTPCHAFSMGPGLSHGGTKSIHDAILTAFDLLHPHSSCSYRAGKPDRLVPKGERDFDTTADYELQAIEEIYKEVGRNCWCVVAGARTDRILGRVAMVFTKARQSSSLTTTTKSNITGRFLLACPFACSPC